ncbi:MAG TPA: hypothetical protein VGM73_02435 [Candidatus Didemnitutus sp.]|jgi:hypothetical protein
MNWILEHAWVLVVIAGLFIRGLQSVTSAAKKARPPAEPQRRREFVEAELADRNRKVREEVRRKIEERRGQKAVPSSAPARPRVRLKDRSPEATTPPPVVLRAPVRRDEPESQTEPPPIPASASDVELARQAALADELRAVVTRKETVQRRATLPAFELAAAEAALAVKSDLIGADFGDPAALRRAILLREVLGPPLALRD